MNFPPINMMTLPRYRFAQSTSRKLLFAKRRQSLQRRPGRFADCSSEQNREAFYSRPASRRTLRYKKHEKQNRPQNPRRAFLLFASWSRAPTKFGAVYGARKPQIRGDRPVLFVEKKGRKITPVLHLNEKKYTHFIRKTREIRRKQENVGEVKNKKKHSAGLKNQNSTMLFLL